MVEHDTRIAGPEPGRPRRPAVGVLWLSLFLAVGLVGAACSKDSKDDTVAVSGYVRVNSMDLLIQRGPETGFPCSSAERPFADVRDGAPVVVTDDKGTRIGTTSLGEGSTYLKVTGGRSSGCEWPFTVKLRSAHTYRFAVAGQPPVVMSSADVKANRQQLEVRFGSGA